MEVDAAVIEDTGLTYLRARLEPWNRRLASHPLYDCLRSVEDVRVFMSFHIFAVWDFMCLLKALQRHLTCVDLAWRPTRDAMPRRLVNELVLEEESDEIDGEVTSHFDFYRRAMRCAGAATSGIDRFVAELNAGVDIDTALGNAQAARAARKFVATTFDAIRSGKPHVVAASFTFGREEAIPGMFGGIIGAIDDQAGALHVFGHYLRRHVELDGGSHGPKAVQMLTELCGNDPLAWQEATDAAVTALAARLELWDAVQLALTAGHGNVQAFGMAAANAENVLIAAE